MASEFHELTISYTVKDYEKLPDGLYAEDVSAKVWRVAKDALRCWYGQEGHRYFATEPDFAYDDAGNLPPIRDR